MNKLAIIAFLVIALIACAPVMPQPQKNQTQPVVEKNETTPVEQPTETNETTEEPTEKPQVSLQDVPKKEVIEGDLVSFPNLKAVDPDGDPIDYKFSSPLSNKGEWQTKEGDAGDHLITITASDGTNTVSQQVLIVVKQKNQPPVIELEEPIETTEGETLTIELTTSDPDGDTVNVTFSGWMENNTKEVGYDDAGNHKVVITATDGKATTSKEVFVVVGNANRAPELEELAPIKIKEGQKASVKPSAEDPDGDALTFSYDFPINETGSWQTEIGDAGDYEVKVTASDGELTVEAMVIITVEAVNRPPVIELDTPVTIKEGDAVTLEPVITDPEGEEVRISYTGWMNTNTKTTGYDDSGEHTVTIIARDTSGNEARLEVQVIVEDLNRPPIFGAGSFN